MGATGFDDRNQVREALAGFQFQLDFDEVREPLDQVIFRSFRTVRAGVIGCRTVPCDDPEFSECGDFVEQRRGLGAGRQQHRESDQESHRYFASGYCPAEASLCAGRHTINYINQHRTCHGGWHAIVVMIYVKNHEKQQVMKLL